MLDLGRFCAWVTIEDEEAPEYCVEILDDGESATCWIASEAGKSFAVQWKDRIAQDVTGGTVCVDGAWVSCTVNEIGCTYPMEVSAALVSGNGERPLTFSETEYTEDDAYLDQVSPDLGTITLKLDQINITSRAETPHSSTRFAPYQQTKIHERSKKLNKHSVKFGSERAMSISTTWAIGSAVKQLASFTFKYRPLEFLQVQGIAPRPEPLNVVNEDESISDDDVKPEIIDDAEIDAQLQELQAKMDALKEKKNINRVKREHVPVFLPGEVIDLT